MADQMSTPVRFQTETVPGQNAPIHAAMRADAMLEKGDLDGYATWRRILRAVEELQRAEPAARVH